MSRHTHYRVDRDGNLQRVDHPLAGNRLIVLYVVAITALVMLATILEAVNQ